MMPALIRFVPRPGHRVNAREASYIIGVLDVAGYECRGVLPDDAIDYRIAIDTLRITRRDRLLLQQRDPTPRHGVEVFVRVGEECVRPEQTTLVAPGAGTPDDPIDHRGDSIATTRAILKAATIPETPEARAEAAEGFSLPA